jgi:hypothetical protein
MGAREFAIFKYKSYHKIDKCLMTPTASTVKLLTSIRFPFSSFRRSFRCHVSTEVRTRKLSVRSDQLSHGGPR